MPFLEFLFGMINSQSVSEELGCDSPCILLVLHFGVGGLAANLFPFPITLTGMLEPVEQHAPALDGDGSPIFVLSLVLLCPPLSLCT